MAKSASRWTLWSVLPLVAIMGAYVLAQDEIYVDPDNADEDGTYETIQEAIWRISSSSKSAPTKRI
jgi:hypothetical protein